MTNIWNLRNISTKILILFGIFFLYFIGARLGFLMTIPTTNVSPVWLASGLAFSGMMVFGYWIWPGVMLGEFLANLFFFINGSDFGIEQIVAVSFAHAIGCTLEPLVGVSLIKKFLKGQPFQLDKSGNVFIFLAAAALAGSISSIFGATSLGFAEAINWSEYNIVLGTWLIGDTTGIILVVPFVYACAKEGGFDLRPVKILEFCLIIGLLLGVCQLAFAPSHFGNTMFAQPYFLLPVLTWGAFRLDMRLITGAVILVCSFAVWKTVGGHGPFISGSLNESLLKLQMFICMVSITTVVLSSVIAEKKAANARILTSNRMLEEKVEERVKELKEANNELARHREHLQEMVDEKTRELQLKSNDIAEKARDLEDANATLRVLLKQRDRDKHEFERKVINNLNNFVLPHLQKIEPGQLDDKDRSALAMVNNGLNDIFSSFATSLSAVYSHLTPREMQVANMVSEGKVNKEIAELLGLSVRSVETHRDHIRAKLGLKGKKITLRNYLQSKAQYP